ncbi:hypothetical protein CBR_g31929 [Chara braunii]|uniref:CCHC-type domain-containing protein n=1 Tax=Chara braunii TaxID=69332 RepID=A0A388LG64_CHABU|nr:hypothetical protein CBR_g31929 [Chara braunii]|eukprot:GBG81257.1 hypothetical protein CBR_g31929 [Chara braunii]
MNGGGYNGGGRNGNNGGGNNGGGNNDGGNNRGGNGDGGGNWNGGGNNGNGNGDGNWNNGGGRGNWGSGGNNENGNGGGRGGWNSGGWNRWNCNGGSNGGNQWNNGGGGDWKRSVKCYNCNQYGHISRECDAPRQGSFSNGGNRNNTNGASSFNSENEPAIAAAPGISKKLEESLRMVCLYTNRQIEREERHEAEAHEAEERRKRNDQERTAKEEKSRLELDRKKAKEKKEADREWKLEMILAKQKENLREEFKRMFEKKLKNVIVSQRTLIGKDRAESNSDDEEPMEERLEKRKRQPVPTCQVDASGESPVKVGRASSSMPRAVSEERSPRLGVPHRRTKNEGAHLGYPYQDSGLWEGAPSAEDYTTITTFRKVVRKFLGKKLKPTIEEMCKEVGVVYLGRPEVVDELVKICVMYFSTQTPPRTVPAPTPTPRPRNGGIVIREAVQRDDPQDAIGEPPQMRGTPGLTNRRTRELWEELSPYLRLRRVFIQGSELGESGIGEKRGVLMGLRVGSLDDHRRT